MPTFVLMTRLRPETMHDARGRRAMGKEWLKKVKESCPEVHWIAHYAILGPYDFMDIYDARRCRDRAQGLDHLPGRRRGLRRELAGAAI